MSGLSVICGDATKINVGGFWLVNGSEGLRLDDEVLKRRRGRLLEGQR